MWENHSPFVKLGFAKVSQVEREVLLPCKGCRGLSLIPLGDKPFLLLGPQGEVGGGEKGQACRHTFQVGSLKGIFHLSKAVNTDHLPQPTVQTPTWLEQGRGRAMRAGNSLSQLSQPKYPKHLTPEL